MKMKISGDWAVVAFLAFLAACFSGLELWTNFPWTPSDADLPLLPGVEAMMQIYAESNIGWRGESVSTGLPIWMLVAVLLVVHSYLFVGLIMHRLIRFSVPAVSLSLVFLVVAFDSVVALSRKGETGLGLWAAALSCVLGFAILLAGIVKNKSSNKSEQDSADQRLC
ncbi:MAG: hypothetical protein MUF31_10995 [Akkermansiaceae bacterium]|jgi:hypothetical protein|nr:hypothetical protein [Akkermansiaceae bacterium]